MAGAVTASMQGKPQFSATVIQQVLRPYRASLLGIARPLHIPRASIHRDV